MGPDSAIKTSNKIIEINIEEKIIRKPNVLVCLGSYFVNDVQYAEFHVDSILDLMWEALEIYVAIFKNTNNSLESCQSYF